MAAAEVDLEERTQGRCGGGCDTDTCFDGRPNGYICGGVEEVLDVGEVLDKGDADDCCGRGAGIGLVVCGLEG